MVVVLGEPYVSIIELLITSMGDMIYYGWFILIYEKVLWVLVINGFLQDIILMLNGWVWDMLFRICYLGYVICDIMEAG